MWLNWTRLEDNWIKIFKNSLKDDDDDDGDDDDLRSVVDGPVEIIAGFRFAVRSNLILLFNLIESMK